MDYACVSWRRRQEMDTEPHREDSEPSTYVRGYHKLATEDPHTSDNRHTDPQGPYPTPQPYTGAGPSYTPAPHVQSSATVQQNSNVREHNLSVLRYLMMMINFNFVYGLTDK